MAEMLRTQPALHCIVLAENGSELSAVSALKSGAKDYLPLARITRDQLLTAITEACAKRARGATQAAQGLPADAESSGIEVPGYSIVKEIATSNFSPVFLARSERLRRNVVLKVMNRGESQRELDDAERFQREYEIISSITHRAIAEIYDFGSLPHHLYLAMEYFPCGDLRDRLRNPLSVDESLYYLRAIAEALRVIHVFGILHRDLKPANVMLREDNSPVLIDFGLARRSLDDAGTTGIGQVLGLALLHQPRAIAGPARRCAHRSLQSGRDVLRNADRPEALHRPHAPWPSWRSTPAPPVPTLPAATAAQQPLLDRLMAKRQNARYASADELLADLGPVVAAVA